MHGGSTPTAQATAAARAAVAFGAPMDIDPWEALTWCVHLAAGEVGWFTREIANLVEIVGQPESSYVEVTDKGMTERITKHRHGLNVLVKARAIAMDRLAMFSAMAIKGGIEERQVRAAERYGDVMARLLAGVLGELVLTVEQQARAPEVVRRQLALVEASAV